jgi:hypothetical protein
VEVFQLSAEVPLSLIQSFVNLVEKKYESKIEQSTRRRRRK